MELIVHCAWRQVNALIPLFSKPAQGAHGIEWIVPGWLTALQRAASDFETRTTPW